MKIKCPGGGDIRDTVNENIVYRVNENTVYRANENTRENGHVPWHKVTHRLHNSNCNAPLPFKFVDIVILSSAVFSHIPRINVFPRFPKESNSALDQGNSSAGCALRKTSRRVCMYLCTEILSVCGIHC